MSRHEFMDADMLAAGVSVLQQSLNTSNPHGLAAKVFQAMSEAREVSRERKVTVRTFIHRRRPIGGLRRR
jgi:hypothetical protein